MKLCKDCFYYEPPVAKGDDAERYSRCTVDRKKSVVTGKPIITINYCDLMRNAGGKCGAEANLYAEPEPREMWQRDEPQGVTNWDTGWNGQYAEDNHG